MKRLIPVFGLLFLLGCAGEPKMLPMRDSGLDPGGPEKGMKTVEFPKGTWTGNASTEQASTLAQTFVSSHNMAMKEFDQVKNNQERIKDNQEKIKGSLKNLDDSAKRMEEANQKLMELAQKIRPTLKRR